MLIGATLVVAVGYWLGAGWLASPVLGVPTGLYAIVVLFAVIRWGDRVRLERVSRQTGSSLGILVRQIGGWLGDWFGRIPGLITARLPRMTRLREVLGELGDEIAQTTGEIACVWRLDGDASPSGHKTHSTQRREHRRSTRATRPTACTGDAAGMRSGAARAADHADADDRLRIGYDLPESWAGCLLDAGGDASCAIEWVETADPSLTTGRACRELGLDGVVRYEGVGTGRVRLLTRPGLDQDDAQDDWAKAEPISYATVFPGRLDPIAVTLGRGGELLARDVPLAQSVIASAGWLRRAHLSGHELDYERARMAMRRSVRQLGLVLGGQTPADLVASACESISSAACLWSDLLPPGERVEVLEAIRRERVGDPAITLRLAAACLADFQDTRGRALLDEASDELARRGGVAGVSPLGFVLSELEHGEGSGLSLGRVGAASCLLAAATETSEYPFVRDDLFDDMRYAPWLVGRDQDRALLMELYWDRTVEAMVGKTDRLERAGGLAA